MPRRRPARLTVALVVVYAVLGPLAAPAGPSAGPLLQHWQAKRVVRAAAALADRPRFRIESTHRRSASSIRVCWSEPGYLMPADGRDVGCDVVERRGREFWRYDDSVLGAGWRRFL